MLKLILAIILWSVALVGIGGFIESTSSNGASAKGRRYFLGELLFLGLLGTSVAGLGLNYFTPLSESVSFTFLGLGWLIVIKSWKTFFSRVRKDEAVLAGSVVVALSLIAVSSHYNIDTGYYHFPSVMVNRSFPLIPGLANIFGPYGHNSTWFIIESIFTLPPLGWASTFSLNSICALTLILLFFENVEKASWFGFVFTILSLLCINLSLVAIGGLTPDICSYALGSLICLWALNAECENEVDHWLQVSLGVMLAGLAITVKISNLLVLIPTICLILTSSKEQKISHKVSECFKNRPFREGVLGACILMLLWLLRNIFLSGCLIYPRSGTCIVSLPWTMPLEWVDGWLVDVKYHLCGIRSGGSVFSQVSCLKEWSYRLLREPLLKYILTLASFAAFVGIFLRLRGFVSMKRQSTRLINLFFFLVVCPGLVWLFVAPNVRFAPWIFLVCGTLFIGTVLSPIESKLRRRKQIFYLCLLFGFVSSLRTSLGTNPRPIDWMNWPNVPQVEGTVLLEKNNFTISTIVNGFQCWGVKPPCTPQVSPVEIQEKMGRAFIVPKN